MGCILKERNFASYNSRVSTPKPKNDAAQNRQPANFTYPKSPDTATKSSEGCSYGLRRRIERGSRFALYESNLSGILQYIRGKL